MKYEKGHKKVGGRQKGSQNILTKTIKESVLNAYNELQKDPKANIVTWGKANPHLFYPIAAKLIPSEMDIKSDGKPVIMNVIKLSDGTEITI